VCGSRAEPPISFSLSAYLHIPAIVKRSMRILFTLLITSGVIVLHVLDNPVGSRKLAKSVVAQAQSLLEDKEVRIEGLSVLSRTEVERALPFDRSVVWWKLHSTDIQGRLEQNPWIAEANVARCDGSYIATWGCFVVSVTERTPTFVATVDNTRWIIDRDGSFIVPYGEASARLGSGVLVGVEGLASRHSSPDVVRAQLSAATRLLDTVERAVGRPISGLQFLTHGDFAVTFEGVPFPVVFGAGHDSKVPLAEQGERCAELLKRLQDRFADILKVDLAFDRVGVVKFRTAE
jgi:hypothetical protein